MSGNDKTTWLDGLEQDDDIAPSADEFTQTVPGWTEKTAAGSDEKTALVTRSGPVGNEQDEEKTRIHLAQDGSAALADPVAGWLVVIRGPGLGHFSPVGIGMNTIGRRAEERISFPFGDKLISSQDHARIIYDDETRGFLMVPGSGKNLTRIDGKIVSVPTPLENHATIQLSKVTTVRFVAFCGESFDWADALSEEDRSGT